MELTSPNKWGFKDNTKWALIESAPYTASGLNEILATAETKGNLLKIARLYSVKLEGGRYQIIKANDGT